jgi:hypothetical protein
MVSSKYCVVMDGDAYEGLKSSSRQAMAFAMDLTFKLLRACKRANFLNLVEVQLFLGRPPGMVIL